jgi:hypothetical protein
MPYDVFISHTQNDKTFANAVCAKLEQHGIRCWMAPRDINEGESWPSAIIRGLNECEVMVLVFSKSVLSSKQVEREMTAAANRDKIIVPVRIEDVALDGAFAYYLEDRHWLDAITPPAEQHLDKLAGRLLKVLGRASAPTVAAVPSVSVAAAQPSVSSSSPPPEPASPDPEIRPASSAHSSTATTVPAPPPPVRKFELRALLGAKTLGCALTLACIALFGIVTFHGILQRASHVAPTTSAPPSRSSYAPAYPKPSLPKPKVKVPPPPVPAMVTVRICKETHELATIYCPDVETVRMTSAEAGAKKHCTVHIGPTCPVCGRVFPIGMKYCPYGHGHLTPLPPKRGPSA